MKPRRIVAAAPLSLRVNNKTIAPKIIHSNVQAITTPRRLAAAAWIVGTFQNHKANVTVIT